MAQRLMTSFCFASLLAAALVTEGALAAPFPQALKSQDAPDAWFIPFEAVGGLEMPDEDSFSGALAAWASL